MTVKLLMDWPDSRNGRQYVAGNLLTTDAGTETGLVNAKMATSDLTGGTSYVAPVPQTQYKTAQLTTDAGGNVSGLVGPGGVKVPLSKRKNILSQKFMGATGIIGSTSGGAGSTTATTTWQAKFTAEADFDAVRLVYFNHMSNATAIKAIVSATETAYSGTQDNISSPTVGGTLYNVLDSTTDTYGWRSVTWSGSSTLTAAAAATPTGQVPNAPACELLPSISTSDWIPLRSVPRADGGALPLVMVRIYVDGATNQFSFVSDGTKLPLMRTPTAANRGRIIQISSAFGDGTSNLTLKPSSLSTAMQTFGIQYRCRRRGVTVLFVGDSITENNALVADRFSNWGHRACADLSTADLPITAFNAGASSRYSTTYWQHGKQVVTAIKPDVAVFSGWSPNDPPYTSAAVTRYMVLNMLAKTQDFIDHCQQNGVTPIIFTGIPQGGASVPLTAAADAERKWLLGEYSKMAAAGHCLLADANTPISDGATPERIKAAYDSGDGIHPNEAAIEGVFVPIIKTAIQQALMY